MRPSKRAQRKTEKATAGLKDFLIAMGQDPDAIEKAFDAAPLHSDEKMLQAEGVLLHLIKPTRFISKTCARPECGLVFGTSYRSVGYCSDNCRARHLESQTGIRWNPHTDRYRNLEGERPLVIGPQAYQVLVEFAKHILTENRIEVQQIDQTLPPETLPQESQSHVEFAVESLPELVHQSTSDPHTSLGTEPQQSTGLLLLDPENPFDF